MKRQGIFEQSQKTNQAHKDALELLEYLHKICINKGITYSLINDALICYCTKTPFAFAKPSISVAVQCSKYLELLEAISEEGLNEGKYGMANHLNTGQFDSLATWLYKKNRIILPNSRQADAIYYYNRIIIIPKFYAGNTKHEFNHVRNIYRKAMEVLNVRTPLPKKSYRHKLKTIFRTIKIRIRLNKRINICISALLQRLLAIDVQSGFLFCPGIPTNAAVLEDVELAYFEGSECYVPKNANDFMLKNYKLSNIEAVSSQPKSHLLLYGGESLRGVQLVQTEMMVEFDRICRKHNLKYCLSFGTLLGAVRHSGFVPWDDDVDVLMPYEDYSKLEAAMEQDLDKEKFFLRVPEKEKDCNITYMHLKRNDTRYCKPGRGHFEFHPGIFIDIVPLYNGANTRFGHWLYTRICWFFRTATWAHMGADGEKNLFKRIHYKLLAKIGNKKSYALFKLFATMFKQKREKMAFLNGMDRSPYNEELVKRSCFDDMIELEFEGHRFFAPRKYQEILEYCYGSDYMLYPPLSKRFPSHDAEIDLGDAYLAPSDVYSELA